MEVQEWDDARRPSCFQDLVGIFKCKSSMVGMRKVSFLVEYGAGTEDRENAVGKHKVRMGLLFALNDDI